jgi:hypothetical protein
MYLGIKQLASQAAKMIDQADADAFEKKSKESKILSEAEYPRYEPGIYVGDHTLCDTRHGTGCKLDRISASWA